MDDDFVHVNQFLKYLKFGFAKVTDEMSEAIKLGLIKRSEALEIVEKYDGRCSNEYIYNFCKHLDITLNDFWEVCEKNINRQIWTKINKKKWILKHPTYNRELKFYYD